MRTFLFIYIFGWYTCSHYANLKRFFKQEASSNRLKNCIIAIQPIYWFLSFIFRKEISPYPRFSLFSFMHWRGKWQPTPVFLPGESQGWGNLVSCHLCSCTELDMTEATQQQQQQIFPDSSAGKESSCNVGDLGLRPGFGRASREGDRLPTPVFWPGEFHGLYSPWGHKESDMTEQLSLCRFVNKFYKTKFLESFPTILIIVINRRAHHLRRNNSPVLCIIVGLLVAT